MVKNKASSALLCSVMLLSGLLTLTPRPASAALTTTSYPSWNGLMGLESSSVTDPGTGFSVSFIDTEMSLSQDDPTNAANSRWEASVQKKNKNSLPGGLDLAAAAASFKDARWCDSSVLPESRNSGSDSLLRMMRDTRSAAPAMNVNNFSSLNVGGIKSVTLGSSLRDSRPIARGAAVSYTVRPAKNWTFSLSNAFLKESNVLLGAPDSPYLGMGRSVTASAGIGATVNLGGGYSLAVDTVAASGSRSYRENSAVSSASRLTSFGASVVLNKDNMGFTVQKPLRVYSGTGFAEGKRISLKPSGSETDFGFSYKKPLESGGAAGFSLTYRHDADHVAGARDGTALFHFTKNF